MNKTAYLNRIGIVENNLTLTVTTLKLLQKRHLLTVPFENLDIHWQRPIVLNAEKFYAKIVGENRGGFCYELNGLFGKLLEEIGFQNKLISARVADGEGFGAEYDHLAILTKIDGEEYLADVGFGDFAAEPLKFVLDAEQQDANGAFMIRKRADEYFEVVKKYGGDWQCRENWKNLPECANFIKHRPNRTLHAAKSVR